jgi:hypothetical protein
LIGADVDLLEELIEFIHSFTSQLLHIDLVKD